MNYAEAIRFLESFIDYEKITGSYYTEAREELASMKALLERIGHPEKDLRYVHIAGTKGKGSTSAMTASIFTAAGLKTGLYTSPHLIDFRERIQIDGRMISREDCAAQVEAVAHAAVAVRDDPMVGELSFFEVYTALAFQYFRAQNCDMVVLEPGLGGRLDATNVVRPLACAVTLIGHDHEAILGDTLEKIATEKAGILKPGVPVVISPQVPEAEDTLRREATRKGAPVYWIREGRRTGGPEPELVYKVLAPKPRRTAFALEGIRWTYPYLEAPLLGRHQIANAATAVTVAELAARGRIDLTVRSVAAGLRQTRWPGRFQMVGHNPALVLDGAHNPESAVVLRQTLHEHVRYDRLILIFGGMGDHNLRRMAETLFPLAAHVIVTRSKNPRAATTERLLEMTRDLSENITTAPNIPGALDLARSKAGPEDAVLITGSLYVVGEALSVLDAYCSNSR